MLNSNSEFEVSKFEEAVLYFFYYTSGFKTPIKYKINIYNLIARMVAGILAEGNELNVGKAHDRIEVSGKTSLTF